MVSRDAFTGVSAREALRGVREVLTYSGCPDAAFDARELLMLATGQDPRIWDGPLTAEQSQRLAQLTDRREQRWPLQYLAGHWTFLDFDLEVGPGVLIPRADTEVVCEAAAETLRGVQNPVVADLCSGSGALALGIKRLVPSAQVTALEKSPEAYHYLEINAAKALPDFTPEHPAVTPVAGDVFLWQQTLAPASLDLIVSNPPYLTADEMQELQPEVAFEPAMALEAGQDGLDFYRHIAANYRQALRPGGWLVFEIGWQQGDALRQIFAQNGYSDIEIRKDYGGNDRAALAKVP